jgi:hypothetical protein
VKHLHVGSGALRRHVTGSQLDATIFSAGRPEK